MEQRPTGRGRRPLSSESFSPSSQPDFSFAPNFEPIRECILDRKVDRQGVRSVGTGVDNGISSKETLTANVEFGAGEEATVQFSG